MIVYKHHISKHFEEDPSLLKKIAERSHYIKYYSVLPNQPEKSNIVE